MATVGWGDPQDGIRFMFGLAWFGLFYNFWLANLYKNTIGLIVLNYQISEVWTKESFLNPATNVKPVILQ